MEGEMDNRALWIGIILTLCLMLISSRNNRKHPENATPAAAAIPKLPSVVILCPVRTEPDNV
jgi:hypothetical protein